MKKDVKYFVRNYREGDEANLAKMFSECFGPTTERQVRRWFKRTRPESTFFIGEAENKAVSHVNVLFKELHIGEGHYLKTGGIAGVCTDSDYRRKGIATCLLKLSLDHIRRSGASNSSLYTGLDIPAHRIYSELGFVDIATWHSFIKYFDYPFVFARWIRWLNRRLKHSKIAMRSLKDWSKSVVFELENVGTLSFRFRKDRFQRLKKALKSADIIVSTDPATLTRVMRGAVEWEEAVDTRKLLVKRGEKADIGVLKRILRWRWEG